MNANRWLTAFLLFIGWTTLSAQEGAITSSGSVRFVSEAPLERITAASTELKGALQPPTKSFAFSIPVGTFMGFNSDIQRTHFLENYMEQKKFPQATFVGKIIEDVPFDVPGSYSVRAKGQLSIHGIAKERIIKGTLEVTPSGIRIQTDFLIPVADHGITIPKIVKQKIAEQIEVEVEIQFPTTGAK